MTQQVRSITHLAAIMDGNRRWARQNKKGSLYSDRSKEAVYNIVSFCKERNIPHLSLFAFSLENLENRDEALREHIFDILYTACTTDRERLVNEGVRVCFIGSRDHFPARLRPVIEQLEADTASATSLQLNILFCYGAQQEIASAARVIAAKVASGEMTADAITPDTVKDHLWLSHAPPPDLIIRTSGVSRLSNFLLFQAAYSELMFVDYYWPEMTKDRLQDCIDTYHQIERNFGK